MKKISIITIVYNNKDYIADCIKSVFNQTYPNIEYIVIDGGSTDGTKDVIEEYKHKLSCYISEKDNNLYDALNKGIKKATGDIVGIMHSDDVFYDRNTVQTVADVFSGTNTDLVYANGQYVNRNELSQVKRVYTAKPFKKRYLFFGWMPLHTTIYVKRDLFSMYGFYDEKYKIAGDYEISLRWFMNNKIKKVFLNQKVVKMRLGGLSTIPKLQMKKSAEDMVIIKKYHLWGWFTLLCKITRKIPQYIKPRFSGIVNHYRSSKLNSFIKTFTQLVGTPENDYK